MTVNSFVRKLQTLDRKFRFIPGPNRVSGLYKKLPMHPDAADNGLLWVAAVPSPSWFTVLPMQDFYTAHGKEYNRGWKAIVQKLVAEQHLTKQQAKRVFGYGVFA